MAIQGQMPQNQVEQVVRGVRDSCKSLNFGFVNSGPYHENFELTHHRAVADIHTPERSLDILEVGCFTGAVSVSLSRLGHRVTANDVGFILDDMVLQRFLTEEGVGISRFELSRQPLPFADESFDVVILHSVIAHLTFNPIPLLRQFHRVLRPGGIVYCATPNALSVRKVLAVLRREGYLNNVDEMLQNLETGKGMSVGLIWREYTKDELINLFQASGFSPKMHKFGLNAPNHSHPLKRLAVAFMYRLWPSLLPTQIGVFEKTESHS